ncbi:MAG: FtsH protease activity modulator HflK [Lachnospiraceae bacterium]|nr:FtsH protease activity modulator HflK [Lachnospiraceae bacterium]MBQ8948069.1 FtsH protease activity modulator HflK [Lachnospiraceae bacterium]
MDSKEIYQDSSGKGKKIGRIISFILITVIALMVVGSCFYSINEQTNGVVTQFGRVMTVNTAGFYFKAPWQSVKKVDVTTHGTSIGYTIENDTQKGSYPVDEENAIMITSDFNLLNIDFYIEYRVSDPVAYLYNAEDPEGILKNIAMANIRNVVSNYTVDEAMTTGKSQIQSDIKRDIIDSLDRNNIGLSLVNITIQDSRPPVESVVSAFKAVETAKQGADTAMNQALQYKNQQIPSAEADADAIVQKANAYKESRIAEAEGQVARFNDMYEEYKKYPLVTKKRLFYEKMEEILPGMKVVITDGDTQTMMPLESFTAPSDTTSGMGITETLTDEESAE